MQVCERGVGGQVRSSLRRVERGDVCVMVLVSQCSCGSLPCSRRPCFRIALVCESMQSRLVEIPAAHIVLP